jgi:hypothetical protein
MKDFEFKDFALLGGVAREPLRAWSAESARVGGAGPPRSDVATDATD